MEEIAARLDGLSGEELGRVLEYERLNKNRSTLVEQIESRATGGAS